MKPGQLQWVVAFLMLFLFHASATVLYVDLNSTNPVPPYADWTTAATNIQDAVDASTDGDQILVTNGVYQTGGRVVYGSLTNRVAVTKAVTVQSVNGPAVTMLQGNPEFGDSAVRCAYLADGAMLIGFTLTNGATRYFGDLDREQSGGGVWCENTSAAVSNCVLSGNSAGNRGGGACNCTLNNCTLTGNFAYNDGGGAHNSTLNNCTITSNSASDGGGAYACMLSNCTVTGNSANSLDPFGGVYSGGGAYGGVLTNCVLAGNTATYGGAVSGGATLDHCTISNNSALYGGGAAKSYHQDANCILNNCMLVGNVATNAGGGAYGSTLSNCMISNNSISVNVGAYAYGITIYGGGVESCALNNCLLVSNSLSALGYSSYGFGAYGGGADSSTLSNCTIVGNFATNDFDRTYGGGAENSSLNHCTLSGNSAVYGGGADNSTLNYCTLMGNSAGIGGGANGMLTNCLVYGNTAYTAGGGAAGGVLVNCTVVSNSQTQHGYGGGGGVLGSVAQNCIIYYNNSSNGFLNYYYPAPPYTSSLTNCCTYPLPPNGMGNITNAPNFIDLAAGNFHLQTNSPCINAGTNSFIATGTDLDGNPRIVGIAVDMGAYEYQGPTSILPYVWLLQYGLPTDGSADYVDSDGDGMNNWQEWRAGTNPTDALSVLKILSLSRFGRFNMIVTWQSVSNATYYLQRSSNLGAHPAFVTIHSNIPGQAGTTSNTDFGAVGAGPYFYRVGVQ
jgi:hypothetical protein